MGLAAAGLLRLRTLGATTSKPSATPGQWTRTNHRDAISFVSMEVHLQLKSSTNNW
jgi:hypothetical protein